MLEKRRERNIRPITSDYIEFLAEGLRDTIDENTLFDFKHDGNVSGMTMEPTHERAEIPNFSYKQIPT
jgi:uncharacterized protein YuzE